MLHEQMLRWDFVNLRELKPKCRGEVPLVLQEPILGIFLGYKVAKS